MRIKFLSPYWLPVWFFAGAILIGTIILHLDVSHPGGPLSFVDALFTATSAMCVTGLIVVDTGSFFSVLGQDVILILIQFGGLGIMTFTTLFIYLFGKHVSLGDRMAVGQSLLHDPSFSLVKFLGRIVIATFVLEGLGAFALWWMDPIGFSPYSAIFHSVSAFCNAGFSLYSDSLSQWSNHAGINMVFIVLITAGGLGFYVLYECSSLLKKMILNKRAIRRGVPLLSWHSSIVLKTSFFLVIAGAIVIFSAESAANNAPASMSERVLTALFQSVTCRTAGFNTVDIGSMSNVSLVFMMGLMLIGGSPGSCAGGIKTTSFRALCSFVVAQFKGHSQVKVSRFALSSEALNKVLTLFMVSVLLVILGTMVLTTLESAGASYLMGRGKFMVNMFEVISAFGTVGISTGLTANLNTAEKVMIIVLMFVGRLGPMWLLSALQSWQTERRYKLPTGDLPLG
ncbi:TrkH family potassium uptake protein [Pseudodesulfovibrio piezophilus]|uniref:H(+)-transporting two-sector ATPase n=1 Tax=Pseudodesulfovibrio piezophilus (strain DSM 21447 / JCM 15486 / C1TLV30) TaxID=1322246 RepID=M1WP46_PSEP2|nr:potassium transporter TrkG [Pseudodesulfovibrio piezophilus]CCH48034.1 H(+)-transporting two-sector ATPase [Pseudodesulfovibrio piezophilus C1TLV30]